MMTSSGHALGHVTDTEKMQKRIYRVFFHWFNILIFNLIMLYIDFVLFLKGQILREFQNFASQKMQDFGKGMQGFVSNVGFNLKSSTKGLI